MRTAGLHKQEVRTATGLSVFCAMGDLILCAGVGTRGADGRPVLVQAVFRSTLFAFGCLAAWRAWRLSLVLGGSLAEGDPRRHKVYSQVQLLKGNVVGLVALQVYHVGAWMAAAWWPEWRLLPVVCCEIPVIALYVYILLCIRRDLL